MDLGSTVNGKKSHQSSSYLRSLRGKSIALFSETDGKSYRKIDWNLGNKG